jgi:general nucleoside transport system ATP-binding protein
MPPRLELQNISKRYPAVLANDAISLQVEPGQIHAVLGENGAGKSTLMKIIYGAVQPDTGQMVFDGQSVQVRSPQAARALGISMVFQHFSLFDTLSVAQNVWLGLDKHLSLADVQARIRATASEYGLDLEPNRPVHTLSVGERQRVEIVRALLANPRLLILDEPTSVLTPSAVDKLFGTLRQLAAQGCSILYISHKLQEIRDLCSACTVLRGGRVTGVCDPRQESNASLSRMMLGSEPPPLQHRAQQLGDVLLRVSNLSLGRADQFGVDLEAVSLELRAGEVLGVAGVSGNGQQELLAALSGEDARAAKDSVQLMGRDVSAQSPAQRRALGLHFVPEERLGRGAVPSMSLGNNMLLTSTQALKNKGLLALWGGWIDRRAIGAQATQVIARFGVQAGGARGDKSQALARSLSGGNLQKFIVGREISAAPKVLIISQPTWGVDAGASAQIRAEILALRDAGCAVLVVSEELDELFELSDRLLVIAKGRVSPAIARRDATVAQIGEWMSGLWGTSAATTQAEAVHA